MSVKKFVEDVRAGNIDISSYTKKFFNEAKKIDKEFNYFTVFAEQKKLGSSGKLAGLPISVKDCFCVKDLETASSSRILKGYVPVFNAEPVKRMLDEGAFVAGKTVQDEFGFGSFCTNVGIGFKIPLNPFDKKRCCGGSSGGAAGFAQKSSFPHIAIAESTGGSIVNPAAFCGVAGLCPSYGRVSRYGLIDYASSLDKPGVIAKTVEDCAYALEYISGADFKDSTCVVRPVDKYSSFAGKNVKGLKIGVVKEAFGEGTEKQVADKVWASVKKLESSGASYEKIPLPITAKYGVASYYIIAMCEASTNLARYCGIRYGMHETLKGNFDEYFSTVRSKHFGKEAKRRIMLGTFARMAGYRDKYYIKAMKVRTKIINEYKSLFRKFDVLAMPSMPCIAPKFSETEQLTPLQNYMMDFLTVGPNLAGLPHISIPSGLVKGMPVGIMLVADHFAEKKIVQAGGAVEK